MNRFVYRVYYQWSGPNDTNKFASELNADEVSDAFRALPSDIVHRLQDAEALVEISEPSKGGAEALLSVQTIASHTSFREALVNALKSCNLYGKLVSQSQ